MWADAQAAAAAAAGGAPGGMHGLGGDGGPPVLAAGLGVVAMAPGGIGAVRVDGVCGSGTTGRHDDGEMDIEGELSNGAGAVQGDQGAMTDSSTSGAAAAGGSASASSAAAAPAATAAGVAADEAETAAANAEASLAQSRAALDKRAKDAASTAPAERPDIIYNQPQLPAMLPPRRGAVFAHLSTRELDIYAWSDSDDDRVEIMAKEDGKPLVAVDSNIVTGAKDEVGAVKYTLRA